MISAMVIKVLFLLNSFVWADIDGVDMTFANFNFYYENSISAFTSELYIYSQKGSHYQIFHPNLGSIQFTADIGDHTTRLQYQCLGRAKTLEIVGVSTSSSSLYSFFQNTSFEPVVRINYQGLTQNITINYKQKELLQVKKTLNSTHFYEYEITNFSRRLNFKRRTDGHINYSAQRVCTDWTCQYSQNSRDIQSFENFVHIHAIEFERHINEVFQSIFEDFEHCP